MLMRRHLKFSSVCRQNNSETKTTTTTIKLFIIINGYFVFYVKQKQTKKQKKQGDWQLLRNKNIKLITKMAKRQKI